MNYSEFKLELNDMLHGKLGSISSVRSVINRGVRRTNAKLDLRSTRREVAEPTGFFNSIYQIPAPSDLKDVAIIDLGKLSNRRSSEYWTKVTPEEFDRNKGVEEYLCAVIENETYKKIGINAFGASSKITLHEFDSNTLSGAWVASGDASNITIDSYNYLTGSASLDFDIASSANSAVLTNSTITDVLDITNYKDFGVVFLSIYLPTDNSTTITSIGLKIGSDNANYYSTTATTTHDNNGFKKGWNIVSFNMSSATETGTVVDTAIEYIEVSINKPGTVSATNGLKLDQISIILGELHKVVYYSNSYWKSAAGSFLENSTLDTDTLVADEDEIDILLNGAALYCAQVLRETQADLLTFTNMFKESTKEYKYKSERKPTVTEYYKMREI